MADDTKSDGGPCRGCGFFLPPGADTCPRCGRVHEWRGEPYPAGHWRRRDWADGQYIGDTTAKHLLGMLVVYDRPRNPTPGTVSPAVATLSHRMECSPTTVHRALKHLQKNGWIRVEKGHDERGHRAANRYTITSPFSGSKLQICRSQTTESGEEGS